MAHYHRNRRHYLAENNHRDRREIRMDWGERFDYCKRVVFWILGAISRSFDSITWVHNPSTYSSGFGLVDLIMILWTDSDITTEPCYLDSWLVDFILQTDSDDNPYSTWSLTSRQWRVWTWRASWSSLRSSAPTSSPRRSCSVKAASTSTTVECTCNKCPYLVCLYITPRSDLLWPAPKYIYYYLGFAPFISNPHAFVTHFFVFSFVWKDYFIDDDDEDLWW